MSILKAINLDLKHTNIGFKIRVNITTKLLIMGAIKPPTGTPIHNLTSLCYSALNLLKLPNKQRKISPRW